MISDANDITEGSTLDADLCIVGAGAAGITLALELRHSGLQVLLMESGRIKDDPATQALYEGEVVDDRLHSPTDKYRKRVFGGSTTIWGGRSMPLDPIDFESRPYVPNSGWPIRYQDVLPYYRRANELVEAGDFDYSAASALPGAPPVIEGFSSSEVLTDGLERFSCPTNFGQRYGHRLRESPSIRTVLGANCVNIGLAQNAGTVNRLQFKTLEGRQFFVKARRYVIATGGIEVARLLLASRDVMPQGVGNQHDVVGRYYMCHMAANVGRLVVNGPPQRVHHGYDRSPDGVYCRRRFTLPASRQRELGIGNVVARLHFPTITDPAHRNGVLSGLFLAKDFISYEYGKRLQSADRSGVGRYAGHVRNVIADPWDTTAFLLHWIRHRTLSERKFPSVILRNKTNLFSLDVHGEQAPNPDSRITLTSGVDALGMPRARVDWRYLPIDVESVRALLNVLAAEFRRSGVGELTFDDAQLEADLTMYGAYGGHHIGTARMGSDPRTSVVDANCRVHGVDNLYIAGAAVFPTSSQANPTLTLVALAARLAEHLKNNVGR